MTRIILIRHGEPVGHEGRAIGHFDTELAMDAHEALRRAADQTTPAPSVIVSSDLRRCVDSARILAAAWRVEVRFDPRVRELAFGDWEGRAWVDVAATERAAFDAWGADWVSNSTPGGETGVAFAARVRDALDDIVRLADGLSSGVAVVTHAGWIRVATILLLGEPLTAAFDRSIDYAHAAVFEVQKGAATLDAWNVDAISASVVRPPAPPSIPS